MTQHLADSTPPATGADPARIHRLAVLAMVFAIVVPPVGIVLAILVLRQAQRVPRDRGLAIGALVVAFLVLIAELLVLIGLTTFVATTSPTAQSAAGSNSAAPSAATSSSAVSTTPPGGAAADPQGVARACGIVMPALAQVRADVAKVKSPDQYGEVLTQLATTVVTGASATSDPTFLGHVGQLSQAFQKAWQDSSNGTAPSAVADELTTAGAPASRDCTAAGYHP